MNEHVCTCRGMCANMCMPVWMRLHACMYNVCVRIHVRGHVYACAHMDMYVNAHGSVCMCLHVRGHPYPAFRRVPQAGIASPWWGRLSAGLSAQQVQSCRTSAGHGRTTQCFLCTMIKKSELLKTPRQLGRQVSWVTSLFRGGASCPCEGGCSAPSPEML